MGVDREMSSLNILWPRPNACLSHCNHTAAINGIVHGNGKKAHVLPNFFSPIKVSIHAYTSIHTSIAVSLATRPRTTYIKTIIREERTAWLHFILFYRAAMRPLDINEECPATNTPCLAHCVSTLHGSIILFLPSSHMPSLRISYNAVVRWTHAHWFF